MVKTPGSGANSPAGRSKLKWTLPARAAISLDLACRLPVSALRLDMPARPEPADPLPIADDVKAGPTPLYGWPFKCKACGSREVTLFSIDSHADLAAVQQAMAGPTQPAQAPSTHRPPDPDTGFV